MQIGTSLSSTFLVMAGGAFGAALRYHLGRALFHIGGAHWPSGTFAVNVLGGFAMGLLAGWLARGDFSAEPWRLLLGVGLLGGFTTFSAFSLEVLNMVQRGQWALAGGYIGLSVAASVAALFCGLLAMRALA